MQYLQSLAVILIIVNADSFEDVPISIPDELSRDFFMKAGIELEKQDFPDFALRAFRTAQLLLYEDSDLEYPAYTEIKYYIRKWIRHTKARRVGAFKSISAEIELGAGIKQQINWTAGHDLRQVDTPDCTRLLQYSPARHTGPAHAAADCA